MSQISSESWDANLLRWGCNIDGKFFVWIDDMVNENQVLGFF